MSQVPATAFLVADGGRGRLILRHGDGRYEPLREWARRPALRPRQDTRGRVFSGVDHRIGAIDRPDPDAELGSFTAELAAVIDKGLRTHRFDRFVLIAPPRMLALLHEQLTGDVHRRQCGELAKDLTKTPAHRLASFLDPLAREQHA